MASDQEHTDTPATRFVAALQAATASAIPTAMVRADLDRIRNQPNRRAIHQ